MKYKRLTKYFIVVLSLIIVILSFTGCKKNVEEFTKQTYGLGTVINLKVYGENEDKVLEKCIDRLNEIDDKMSVTKEDSEVSKLNSKSGTMSQKVSNDTYYVIQKGLEYGELSKGKFDISIEPLVKLWGIGTKNEKVPLKEDIDSVKNLINYKNVELKDNNEVYLRSKGMAIDLGGIAKGYVGDELKKILKENGVSSAFLNLGGNVVLLGNKPDGSKWRIGIQNPLGDKGKYIGVLSLTDKSVVTSGNYERYFVKDGKRYHHIFDSSTGYPSESGIISSTIISDKSIDGDSLSTSTYIMGKDKAIELIESLKGVEGIFITKDRKIYLTSGIKDDFELKDLAFTLVEGEK